MRLARNARWSFTEVAVALKWEGGGWRQMQVTNEDRSGKGEGGERRMSGQNHDGDYTIMYGTVFSQ